MNCKLKINMTVWMLIFCITSISKSLYADTQFDFRGFANIGLTHSSNDALGFRTSILNEGHSGTSFAPDSLLGLQVNVAFSEKLDVVGQIVIQDRFDDDASNYIELAFLRYQINRNWSARLGRFSANSYLFSDSRFVGHSLYWVRAPLDVYSTVGAIGNINGAQVNYSKDADFGVIKVGLSYGENTLHISREETFNVTYENLIGLTVELQALDWRMQASYLQATWQDAVFTGLDDLRTLEFSVPAILVPYAAQLSQNIDPDGKIVKYASVGGQYTWQNIEFVAEYGKVNSDWVLADTTSFSYVSVTKHFEKLSVFLLLGETDRKQKAEIIDFSAAQADLPSPAFQQLSILVEGSNNAVRSNSFDQMSISIGARWDLSASWALKVQLDHNRINPDGSGFFRQPSLGELIQGKSIVNVANVSISTVF